MYNSDVYFIMIDLNKHDEKFDEFVHNDYFYIGSSITDFNDFDMDDTSNVKEWANPIAKNDLVQYV